MSDQRLKQAEESRTTLSETPFVVRSEVPLVNDYKEYREYLRHDFFYSCAYCRTSEAEARAIRFTIDHYEPRSARPDLEEDYSNLMYCCEECNRRKGDRYPPPEARDQGYRFFRPDQDIYRHHFEELGQRIEARSNVGEFSIQALDLNRLSLRRLRDIRRRLLQCHAQAEKDLANLKRFPLDQLPSEVRVYALRAIRDAMSANQRIITRIDDLLREAARSPLVDPDLEAEVRARERAAKLRETQALFPGAWRGTRKGSARPTGRTRKPPGMR